MNGLLLMAIQLHAAADGVTITVADPPFSDTERLVVLSVNVHGAVTVGELVLPPHAQTNNPHGMRIPIARTATR